MTTESTTVDLRAIIERAIEPTEPADSILAFFRRNAGKKFTVRELAKLRAELPSYDIRLIHVAGMTQIRWGGTGGNYASLLCAYTPGAFTINPAFLLEHNACHFAARDTRNAERRDLLNDTERLFQAQLDIETWHRAQTTLNLFRAYMERQWLAYGQPLSHDRYELERVIDPAKDGNR